MLKKSGVWKYETEERKPRRYSSAAVFSNTVSIQGGFIRIIHTERRVAQRTQLQSNGGFMSGDSAQADQGHRKFRVPITFKAHY